MHLSIKITKTTIQRFSIITIFLSSFFVNQLRFIPPQRKYKSSRIEVFCKKGVLRNFAKFTGKNLCQGLFLNKVACNFIKKETLVRVFSCEFWEFSKNTFYRWTRLVAATVKIYPTSAKVILQNKDDRRLSVNNNTHKKVSILSVTVSISNCFPDIFSKFCKIDRRLSAMVVL